MCLVLDGRVPAIRRHLASSNQQYPVAPCPSYLQDAPLAALQQMCHQEHCVSYHAPTQELQPVHYHHLSVLAPSWLLSLEQELASGQELAVLLSPVQQTIHWYLSHQQVDCQEQHWSRHPME